MNWSRFTQGNTLNMRNMRINTCEIILYRYVGGSGKMKVWNRVQDHRRVTSQPGKDANEDR